MASVLKDLVNGYSVAVIALVVKSRHTWPVTTTQRRSPGRPAIPLERIVSTALQIVDDEGADALSMRTLAQRLDSGTATLYRHFNSRADLITHVVDRVFGSVELDVATLITLPWQQACKAAAHTMLDALRRHQNVAPLLAGHVPVGPNALVVRERMIAFLLSNGFPPALAARSYATLARYVLGFAIQLGSTNAELDDARLAKIFHDLDQNQFPATIAVADSLPVPWEDEFAFGLELLVDGLTQRLPRKAKRR
jgi:TetR/AcrR family transcriptional regulator, tetracycline repressor protein